MAQFIKGRFRCSPFFMQLRASSSSTVFRSRWFGYLFVLHGVASFVLQRCIWLGPAANCL